MARWDIVIGEDLVAMAADRSHFVGSAIDMPRVRKNLMDHLGFDEAAIRRITFENPRSALAATGRID